MLGYPKECLLKENVNYICPICNCVFRSPVQTSCGHRFCKSCLYDYLEKFDQEVACESCKREDDSIVIIKKDEIRYDKAFIKELSKCQVKCYFEGCIWKGLYNDLEKHLINCEYLREKCILCDKEISRSESHECDFNEKCIFSCSHKYDDVATQRLSKSICRHIAYLKKLFDNLKETIGESQMESNKTTLFIQLNEIKKRINSFEHHIIQKNIDSNEILEASDAIGNHLDSKDTHNIDVDVLMDMIKQFFNHEEFKILINSIVQPQILIQMENLFEVKTRDMALKTAQLVQFKADLMECEKKEQINITKISDLERKLIQSDATIKDLEIRLTFSELTSFDGTLVWQITDFNKKRDDALKGRITSIFSNPFYTSKYGYKMSMRIYLNGDGMGKGTHVSLFFVLMKSNYDALLAWPFRNQVTMYFLDQVNKNHVIDAFKPDPTSSSFRKPVTEMNIASGCPMFMPLLKLTQPEQTYILNDTAYIKVVVNMNEN